MWKFNKYLVLLFIICFSCQSQKQEARTNKESIKTETPSEIPTYLKGYETEWAESPREANRAWFKQAKFGLFMHYGVYSLLERGEWVQLNDKIPVAEYAQLQERFTAENFDADFIADLAIEAGMKYINITAKHHDSFCLFKTAETDFNSIEAPCGRDLIAELYEACEKKGLALFLYYSYGADWKHPYFYPRENGWPNARPAYEEAQPEYKFEKEEDFQQYLDYAHNHLRELLTQYPNIAGIWLDPIMGYYHRPDLFPIEETYALIRQLSPHALISFKQGANGDEDFAAPERSGHSLEEKVRTQTGSEEATQLAARVWDSNSQKHKEICDTMQPSAWGYNASTNGKHKSADDVMEMLANAEAAGANLLLNVGPLPDGSFPEEDIAALKEVGKRLKEQSN